MNKFSNIHDIKEFNGENWKFTIFLQNLSDMSNLYQFESLYLSRLEIYNSLDEFSPLIGFLYDDYGFALSSILTNSGILISVDIEEPCRSAENKSVKFNRYFYIR